MTLISTIRKPFSLFAIIVMITFAGQRCYYDNAEDLYNLNLSDTLTSDSASFINDILPITSVRCATSGCHETGSTSRVPLTNYGEIKLAIDNYDLEKRVVIDRVMPQGSTLTQNQIDLFSNWISNGYPDN